MRKSRVNAVPSVIFFIRGFCMFLGISITRIEKPRISINSVNLNIGSSDYSIPGFTNLDMPSEWYGKAQERNSYIPFNAVTDELPFAPESVDNIYLSHVVEHLPDQVVKTLLLNAFSVLKPGGVIRICTPDAKFLWKISSFSNNYWSRLSDDFARDLEDATLLPDAYDFLSFELASWSRFHGHSEKSQLDEIHRILGNLSFEDCMTAITSDIVYDSGRPGRHISWWSIEKFAKLFSGVPQNSYLVLESKYQGSISQAMTGFYFDKTVPFWSLYVEISKVRTQLNK